MIISKEFDYEIIKRSNLFFYLNYYTIIMQSHFSIKRSAAILGIGTNNCIEVKTDSKGKMMSKDLEQKVEKAKASGAIPFFVSATGIKVLFICSTSVACKYYI